LVVTGERAATVIVGDLEFNAIMELRSCYLDRFGEENKGLKTGRMVELSRVRLDQLTDILLSGDWTDGLILQGNE
jgi:hypothetical protein